MMGWPIRCRRLLICASIGAFLGLAPLLSAVASAAAAKETLYTFTLFFPDKSDKGSLCPGPGKTGTYRTVIVRNTGDTSKPWIIHAFGISYGNRIDIIDFVKNSSETKPTQILEIRQDNKKKLSISALYLLESLGFSSSNEDDFENGVGKILEVICQDQKNSDLPSGGNIYRIDRISSDSVKNGSSLDSDDAKLINIFRCVNSSPCKDEQEGVAFQNHSFQVKSTPYLTLYKEFFIFLNQRGIQTRASAIDPKGGDEKTPDFDTKIKSIIDKENSNIRDIISKISVNLESESTFVRSKFDSITNLYVLVILSFLVSFLTLILSIRDGKKKNNRDFDRIGGKNTSAEVGGVLQPISEFRSNPNVTQQDLSQLREEIQSKIENLCAAISERNSTEDIRHTLASLESDLRQLAQQRLKDLRDLDAFHQQHDEIKDRIKKIVVWIDAQSRAVAPAPPPTRSVAVSNQEQDPAVRRPAVSGPAAQSKLSAPAPVEDEMTATLRRWSAELQKLTGQSVDPEAFRERFSVKGFLPDFGDWLINEHLPQREEADFYWRVGQWLEENTYGRLCLILPEVGSVRNSDFDEVGSYSAPVKGNMNKIVAVMRPGLTYDGNVLFKAKIVIPN